MGMDDLMRDVILQERELGIFGWVSRPPHLCLLSSQAQSVDWHLRKMRGDAAVRDGPGGLSAEAGGRTSMRLSFIEKLRVVNHAGEQIDRVYGELRGIDRFLEGFKYVYYILKRAEERLRLLSVFDNF